MIINNVIETSNQEEREECFICLEERENEICISLNGLKEYSKYCLCNGNIHKSCLDNWYVINPKCPICRNTMIKNPEWIVKYITSNDNLMCIYSFFIKYLLFFLIIMRFVFVVFIIFLISDKVIVFYHIPLALASHNVTIIYYSP